jgi:hypothetical protein
MKIKIGSFFLILSCISTCSFAQIKEKIEVDKIFTDWNKPNVPGGALGVVKDGKLVYTQCLWCCRSWNMILRLRLRLSFILDRYQSSLLRFVFYYWKNRVS